MLDLHEGVLEEFAERAHWGQETYAGLTIVFDPEWLAAKRERDRERYARSPELRRWAYARQLTWRAENGDRFRECNAANMRRYRADPARRAAENGRRKELRAAKKQRENSK